MSDKEKINKEYLDRLSKMSEKELSKLESPWPQTEEELMGVIKTMRDRNH